MKVVFADESTVFDGYSPTSQPLDGPAKALACLSTALAMRQQHEITVINRCAFPVRVEGANWITWDGVRPDDTDVLIACGLPRLLDIVPMTGKRILWATGPLAALDTPEAQATLTRLRPLVALLSERQRTQWSNPLGLPTVVMAPGIATSYLEDTPMSPAEPPVAIATCHPRAGLSWLLKIWQDRIRPAAPTAELHVYSALLDKGQLGATIPPEIAAVFDQAVAGRAHGVSIKRPLPDPQMAEAYRAARGHLHPGAASDLYGFTVAESQAMGLPAVVGAINPVYADRVADGQTGALAHTDQEYAAAAVQLLIDPAACSRMSETARILKRGRSWAVAASEWEDHFA